MPSTEVNLTKDRVVFDDDGSLKGKDEIENDKTEPEAMSADKIVAGMVVRIRVASKKRGCLIVLPDWI